MRRTAMILTAAISGAAAAGCAPTSWPASVTGPGEPVGNKLSVTVENQRPTAMRIFATRANMKFLIGEVGARETARFPMPRMIFSGEGNLRLVADPWGSTFEQESEPIIVTGGSEVNWRLRPGGGERVHVR